MSQDYILSVKNICKYFPGVRALNCVDFDLVRGEVHALVGENGAGKSTLIKILSGVYTCDEGTCFIDGKNIEVLSSTGHINKDVGVIYQELNSAGYLTVAENVLFGKMPVRHGIVQWKEVYRQAAEYLDMVGLRISPKTKVQNLSIAQKQLIEIAKAISMDAKVIIMDEPTSALSPTEISSLFKVIRRLKSEGVSIIYISHKLDEVLEISDRVTILRDGCVVGTAGAGELDKEQLITMMVGREMKELFPVCHRDVHDRVLEVRGLSSDKVTDVTFHVNLGEIVGFSGLMGAGRTEMTNALYGIDKRAAGEILVGGVPLPPDSPQAAKRMGIGLVTENRKEQGIFASLSVKQNISVAALAQYAKSGVISRKREGSDVENIVREMSIKTPSLQQTINKLSGGNQQKALLARWLIDRNLKVLIVDEPTRGIDVAAKSEIYRILSRLAGEGLAIVMISSEMTEILGMCDRIYVMKDGRITGEFHKDAADERMLLEKAIS